MLHRPLLRACAGLCAALAASACDRSPTDPSRPGQYEVTFLGVPAGAESFTPRAVSAGRVVGTARAGGVAWAVQWAAGTFTRIGPDVPAGCESEALGARGPYTVGEVTCRAAAGDVPVDAYGWTAGIGALPRLFAAPYAFVDVSGTTIIAGTVNPRAQFPTAEARAFRVENAVAALLLPPGAIDSEAAGVSDAGAVAVTGYFDCAVEDDDCARARVFVWSGGAWTEVPLPRGATSAVAAAVSSEGHVAGYSQGGGGGVFLWEIEDRDLDLVPVVPGTRVEITGVNRLGQIVGTGTRTASAPGRLPSYGIIWGDDRQYSISERIVGNVRWQVTAALGTDDDGRIVGTAVDPESGQEGAVLLTPLGGV
jgi:hypothetical protein